MQCVILKANLIIKKTESIVNVIQFHFLTPTTFQSIYSNAGVTEGNAGCIVTFSIPCKKCTNDKENKMY